MIKHLWKKAHIMASIKKLHIHEGLASVLKVNNTGMQNPPPPWKDCLITM